MTVTGMEVGKEGCDYLMVINKMSTHTVANLPREMPAQVFKLHTHAQLQKWGKSL